MVSGNTSQRGNISKTEFSVFSQKYFTKVSFNSSTETEKISRENTATHVPFSYPYVLVDLPVSQSLSSFLYSLQLKCLSSSIKK